jgi:hypothetical protein
MKQFLLLVRLRSRHPETVRAALLSARLSWVLQEEEGQALLRSLLPPSEPGQQGLVQACLPLVEPWETDEQEEQDAALGPQRSISLWGLLAGCTSRLRAIVLGQGSRARVQFCLARLRRFVCPSPRRRLHRRLWFQAWVKYQLLGTHLQGGFL